ncbi:MAG TPA: hypothetical protein VJ962_05845 [Clostridia bacterium]|nr:hypothetical protein [Clostridia bacterium]
MNKKLLRKFKKLCIKKGQPLAQTEVNRSNELPMVTTLIRRLDCDKYSEIVIKAGFKYYIEDEGYPKMKPGQFCDDCLLCPATCGRDLKECKRKALKEKIYFTDNYIKKEVNYG